MNQAYRIFAALLLFATSLAAPAAVTAALDRDRVAAGETVRLLLQREGSAAGQPDLDPLRRDFDVLGSSRGSSVQIINGQASSKTQFTLVLAPKHDGTIRIPPLQWDGELSPALELTVGGAGAAGRPGKAAGTSHVFLSATPNLDRPYVQAAVVLTVKLDTDLPLSEARLDLPASADVLVKQFGEDRQGSEMRNGHNYQFVERKYLLFPQHSGLIRLEGPVLDAQLPGAQSDDPFGGDPFFGKVFGQLRLPAIMNATQPLHLTAKTIELNVLPRPVGTTGSNWLPAQKISLEESWRPDNASVRAGEPITRHLRLAALGLTGAQLPDLTTLMQIPDGIKLYPDQSRVEDKPQGATILGSREQDIALMAQQPGHYVLPAVHLTWWDTVHDAQRELVLPSRSLEVLPAVAGSAVAPISPPARSAASISSPLGALPGAAAGKARFAFESPWPWLSLALGLLWLGTLIAWRRTPRRSSPASPGKIVDEATPAVIQPGRAFKAFQQACRANDPQAARRHLLDWARSAWPEQAPLGLNALSRLIGDAELAEALRQLDRACYTNGAWQGESLAQALAEPRSPAIAAKSRQVLPDLYP